MKTQAKIGFGLLLGALAGGLAAALLPGAGWILWFADNVADPAGQIFLRVLFMTVIPLVFLSVTLAVAGLGDPSRAGGLCARALGYFVLSTGIAAVVGLILVNLFDPGEGLSEATRVALTNAYRTRAEGMQGSGSATLGGAALVRIFPLNPFQSAAGLEMLPFSVFSLLVGVGLALTPGQRAEPVVKILDGLRAAVLKIVELVMRFAPIGVFGLVFGTAFRFGWDLLQPLASFVTVVVAGFVLFGVLGLSTLVWVFAGVHPARFWVGAWTPLITGLSTTSSAATLPVTMATAEDHFGVSPDVSGLVLPFAVTLNVNGTAIFQAVALVFLAQLFGVELGLGMQMALTAQVVGLILIGAPGIPGGSLPPLVAVLGVAGVPPVGIAVILGVDRLLDMGRTALNVVGDLSASLYIERVHSGRPAAIPGAD